MAATASIILFALTAGGYILTSERSGGWLIWATKPLMMPLLAIAYLLGSISPSYWIVTGLFLGGIGDASLIGAERGNRFLVGLAAFLAGHLAYVAGLLEPLARKGAPEPWMLLPAAGLAVAGFVVYRLLRPGLGTMKGPVILYTTVILAMALAALVRAPVVSGPAFWLPLSGAIFLIISDTVLAYRTFPDSPAGIPDPWWRWGIFSWRTRAAGSLADYVCEPCAPHPTSAAAARRRRRPR